ncbi:2OG-Fe(II) oxygenase [Caulobacter sp.]|uniref:2OG-Fe(II) oxygenase n=1 Tax=Caulobacter sp. TaxID=78 RepID=UPI001B133C0C|nr:2OG-Fe(II) oxygenase [Caulobacter sp.]MBO9545880.1 2OG-Fe(II) oxygenase [Caulobacter sp.]
MTPAIPPLESSPYPHVVTDRVIPIEACRRALAVLGRARTWRPNDNPLYEGDAWCGDFASVFPDARDAKAVSEAAHAVLERFSIPLSEERSFAIMRQGAGQATQVHNDRPRAGEPTHRIMLYLAEPEEHYSGGQFCVFSTPPTDIPLRRYAPIAGSMIAFEASAHSYHAVAPISAGERVVLVMQFHHSGNCPVRLGRLNDEITIAMQAWRPGESTAGLEPASGDLTAKALAIRFGVDEDEFDHALKAASAADDPANGAKVGAIKARASRILNLPEPEYVAWWSHRLARKRRASFDPADWRLEAEFVASRRFARPQAQALIRELYPEAASGGLSPLSDALAGT